MLETVVAAADSSEIFCRSRADESAPLRTSIRVEIDREPRRRAGVLLSLSLACSSPPPTLAQRGAALIYGEDDRVDWYAVEDGALARLARESSVALLREESLRRRPDGRFDVLGPPLREHLNACASEAFEEQTVAARCSGVLVDERLILTAGHCALSIVECAEQRWVFNYALAAPDEAPLLTDDDVYRCVSVPVSRRHAGSAGQRWDYAWIELDRPVVPPRRPAPLGVEPVAKGERVVVIGYPNGIPLKLDTGAQVLAVRPAWYDYFTLNSDTFDGSSGSAVFDQRAQLAGVFVRGGRDHEYREDAGCFASRRIAVEQELGPAEQASYWGPAVAELCATGWPSDTLCRAAEPPAQAIADAGWTGADAARPFAGASRESGCAIRSRAPGGAWATLLVPALVGVGLARRQRRGRRRRGAVTPAA